MKRVGAAVGALVLVVAAVGACADLGDYPVGVCGNAVLENDGGKLLEQCDTHVGNDEKCGEPDSAAPCRFTCEVRTDGDRVGQPYSCPTGFSCGADAICRLSSGEYELQLLDFNFVRAHAMGDINGDGADDLLSAGLARMTVDSFESDGTLLGTQIIGGGPEEAPRVGPVDAPPADGFDAADAVYPLQRGIVVARGTPQGLQPQSYASIKIQRSAPAFIFSVPGTVAPAYDLSYAFAILRSGQGFGLYILESGEVADGANGLVELVKTLEPAGVPRSALTANFNALSPTCHEVVFTYQDVLPPEEGALFPTVRGGSLWTFAPCGPVDFLLEPAPPPREIAMARLDGGPTPYPVSEPAAVDIDENGTLDIVVEVNVCDDETACPNVGEVSNGCCWIYAAYGTQTEVEEGVFVQDGGFNAEPDGSGAPDTAVPRFEAALADAAGTPRGFHPLAWGDFNADGRADFVDPFGVFERLEDSLAAALGVDYGFVGPNRGLPWTSAEVGDFDLDGVHDLVATPVLTPAIHYLRGTRGGSLGYAIVQLDLPVSDLAVGDFDGDGRPDIAGRGVNVDLLTDEIRVLYAEGATFSDSVLAGSFPLDEGAPAIQQMVVGKLPDPLDAADDLAAILQDPEGGVTIALFSGTSDRQPVAPITITKGGIVDVERVEVMRRRREGEALLSTLVAVAGSDAYAIDLAADAQIVGDPRLILALADDALAPLLGPGQRLPRQTNLVTGDLDRDGLDELVVTIPFCRGDADECLAVTLVAVLGPDLTIVSSFEMPGFVFREPFLDDNPSRPEFVELADVDDDGDLDLVLLVFSDETQALASAIVRNEGEGTGVVMGAPITLLPYPGPAGCPGGGPVETSALGNAVARGVDGRRELLVAGEFGLYRTPLGDDPAAACPERLASVSPEIVVDVVVGDVNADGIDDLVLNRFYTELYLGGESLAPPPESP